MNRPLGCFTGTALIASLLTVIVGVSAAVVTSNEIFNPGGLNAQTGDHPLGEVWSHAELAGECGSCHAPFWGIERMGDRCMDCHSNVQKELQSETGLHGGLADPMQCRNCHPEHRGATAALIEYDELRSEHENLGFSLLAHQKTRVGDEFQCQDCHAVSMTTFDQATCATCHSEIEPQFVTQHALEYGQDCLACHNGVDRYGSDFNHQSTAFPLLGKHGQISCGDCHVNARSVVDFEATPSTCIGCHQADDIHQGRWGEDCAACHSQDTWMDATFDHNLTTFPVIGGHAILACEDCHINQQWTGIPTTCISCHREDDVHEGRLGEDCESCHWATDWNDLIDPEFDHGLTGFPLNGGHVNVVCQDCHLGGQVTGISRACVSCHQADDVHQGRLGTTCESCHNTGNWRDATVDHSQTRFPLRGAHVDVSCDSCHINGQLTGIATTCAGCHRDDFHKGELGTKCEVCHNESSWNSTFDHQQSAFPLTGAHTQVACETCHKNGQYNGTSSQCVDCHSNVDAHGGSLGKTCSQCHSTSAWVPATLDHDQTGFPLTGAHKSATCQGCHPNGNFSNTPKLCVQCHIDQDIHNGEFGEDCGACHSTSSWPGVSFDHSNTGFPLTGKHNGVTCTSCHTNGTYAGTPSTCIACHQADDVHNGAFGTNCGACHSPSGWGGAQVDHNQTNFPLTGVHVQATCASCHVNGQYQGTPTTCVACHAEDDAHGGSFGTDCAGCHSTSGWGGATFDHSATGFPLTGAHTSTSCTNCHTGGTYEGTPTQCAACHAEPSYHAGLFGSSCADCHSTNAWAPASYDGNHSFPMNHKDANGNCSSCHPTTLNDYVCTNCHVHSPEKMVDKHEVGNINEISDCATCHPNGKKD